MTRDFEFVLSRMGYKPVVVLKEEGRFYSGQRVWGRFQTLQKQWEIVNESGQIMGTLSRYAAKIRRNV